jgi:protein-S-isoprenylcysteine O-methyltransferase Ste14
MDSERREHSMTLKIPPPILAVLLALLMWGASKVLLPLWPSSVVASYLALSLAIVGTAVDMSAKRLFLRAGTTVNPMKPEAAVAMVRGGAYRWSRNPMYLGRSIQLLAIAIYLASWTGLLAVAFFVAYLDRFQIKAEERALAARFPDEYPAYKASTRRWL